MNSSDPGLLALLLTRWADHLVVYAIATWSGLVGHLHRRHQRRLPFSLVALISDVLLSGFVGIVIFWIGVWQEWPSVVVALCAGMAGHAAPRTIWLLERKFFAKAGLVDDYTKHR